MIGWPCIKTCRSRGNAGEQYQRCLQRRDKWYGPVGFTIKLWRRICYYTWARVGWWQHWWWKCSRFSIIRNPGVSREWRIAVRRTNSGSTSQWLMHWRLRGSGQSKNKLRDVSPSSQRKWPARQSMSCALGRYRFHVLFVGWCFGTRTWKVEKNNP